MKFSEVIAQTLAWLQREGRVSYRALKREFELDDEFLEDLKAEIIEAKRLAIDENGKVLVWVGNSSPESRVQSLESEGQGRASTVQILDPRRQTLDSAAERRQLTVMFCDLVGSTALSEQLDPEELREVVRAYQATCTDAVQRYAGHIAQHLGDGLLVYFGYPAAHEDEAQRAVRTGLEILARLQTLTARLQSAIKERLPHPIQVRIGIHTGLVVIGEIGSSEKREFLALGETPNIAARLQGLAEPDTVVLSAATHRLVVGLFECQELGLQTLKGISTPLSVYRVVRESEAQSRFEAAVISRGLTPLVGREDELGLLRRRWAQAKAGEGQVVLLSGEPGIGKSRLVQELKEQLSQEGTIQIEFRCSPYHQNSALYPVTEHLRRVLGVERDDSAQIKLGKLEQTLSHYRFPQADTLPLLAALLSLPHPAGIPPLTLSPEQQKEKTLQALVRWLCEEAERQAVYCAWEDLHWADPSTLKLLALYLDQVPTARMLALLTFRPEFTPPWGSRSYLSQLTLSRLGRAQVERIVENVTGGRTLPDEVVEQVVAKTDGVPLFVEELTKTVIELGFVRAVNSHYELTRPLSALAIPATLHDSLMARLDRLAEAKAVAQLGATLGREFSYELLQAVASVDEATLQRGLAQLVDAELVYQRGLPPHAHYIFKHALVQDTAYQSLLKRERQRLHQQIAQVLVDRFIDISATQPELVAHHYTEAGLGEHAIPYWQKAGERAVDRSAYAEAISHLSKGLELLTTLPETVERLHQELNLQIPLGLAFMATKGKGFASSEVGKAYTRARELCRQMGETPQLAPVLYGLWMFHLVRGELPTAYEAAEQLLRLGQNTQDPILIIEGHNALGQISYFMGKFAAAREHMEQAVALYDARQSSLSTIRPILDPGVLCQGYAAWSLWHLGYPDQALQKVHEAFTLAQELSHPLSFAYALYFAFLLHGFRKERQLAQEKAKELIAVSSEHGFPYWAEIGTFLRGSMLVAQGQVEEGLAQMRQGMENYLAEGTEQGHPSFLSGLAAAHGSVGQIDEGLALLTEALAILDKTGQRLNEVELYLLKGSLLLKTGGQKVAEAEECFRQALDVARRQGAKSLELQAVIRLCRLWRQQGKKDEAQQQLAEIYGWFTEGFDTRDLKEAKALLEELT
jgi:class 3 adenylate cyclase/predicted ATPase